MTINKCLTDQELTLYCSEDLSTDEMRIAVEHISSCTDCARSLTAIKKVLSTLPQQELKLSAGEQLQFSERVLEATRKKPATGKFHAWGAAATAITAGALAVIVFSPTNMQVEIIKQNNRQFAELDLVENIDFLEELELLEMMDLLEMLDERG